MKKLLLIPALLILVACENKVEAIKVPESKTVIETPAEPVAEASLRTVNVSAARFEFTPSVIRAKQGEKVLVKVTNEDTTHNIVIPGLKISDSNEFMLDTSKKGSFDFSCANFCGSGHGSMKGTFIIE